MKKIRTVSLKTPFQNGDWSIYPRPQMRRDSFISLCGEWELSAVKEEKPTSLGAIIVPFPPESSLSGIERTLEKDEHYVYEKTFSISNDFFNEKTLLHFGAVDQIAKVFLNGVHLGDHIGGYLPFSFDVTAHIRTGENTLTVDVIDELDTDIPYGKQRKKRGGMWYTPISGIWQQVWLESVAHNAIESIRLTPTLSDITIEITGGAPEKNIRIKTEHGILTHTFTGNRTTITIPSPHLWTPEDPYLYDFTLTSEKDTVRSYFALRTITAENKNGKAYLALNGKPYFFHGLLDQGYFSDGIYMPATPEGFRFDIETMKKLGFNMLRKHIKIEPEAFYYDCDRLGMIVFQDMVNSGNYQFLIDTALPTIGLKKGISHRAATRRKEIFEHSVKETLAHLYNHPCVCYYTVFNEGWGQYDADRLYDLCQSIDPTRIYDSTSGWFTETKSDVQSEHIYFKPIKLKKSEKPLVLSEFGGYSCKIDGHSFNLDKTYGYRFFKNKDDFMNALEALYLDEVIPAAKNGLCAAVLTQVSDVEDETNGLLTYDRQVLKVDEKRMQEITNKLKEAFTEYLT